MRSVVALLVASASSRPLDLDPAIRRFLVLTQPRSGSTWFCKYSANLAAFSGVVTAGEALHPESVQRYRSRTGRNADPDASLAGYLAYVADVFEELGAGRGFRGDAGATTSRAEAAAAPPVRAVGFKIMYHQLPRARGGAPRAAPGRGLLGNVSAAGLLDWCAANGVVVVHLARVNQLERYISLRSIEEHGLDYHAADGAPTAYSTAAARPGDPTREPPKRVRLDPALAFAFAKTQQTQNDAVRRLVSRACAARPAGSCAFVDYEAALRSDAPFRALRVSLGLGDADVPVAARRVVACRARVSNWHEVSTSIQLERTVWVRLCANRNVLPPRSDVYGAVKEFVRKPAGRRARPDGGAAAPLRETRPPPGAAPSPGFARAKRRSEAKARFEAKRRDAAERGAREDAGAVAALFG